jgi:hypothetical protein
MSLPLYPARAALVVAHPSHELRLHGWLEQAKPYVCVLTDGAGRSGEPRLTRTTEVLSRAGARQGAIYGPLTDLEVYASILNGDADLFAEIVEQLVQAFVDEGIEYVVGDAAEGYNVTHDICRVMIGAAVELAEYRYGHRIENFDFAVVGPPDECLDTLRDEAIWLQLDEDAFDRKVKAALNYSPNLASDVESALAGAPFRGVVRLSQAELDRAVDIELGKAIPGGVPLDAFRVECLRPAHNQSGTHWTANDRRFYELYGEKLVAAGRYKKVIRYEQHILPLARAMRAIAEREERCVGSAF